MNYLVIHLIPNRTICIVKWFLITILKVFYSHCHRINISGYFKEQYNKINKNCSITVLRVQVKYFSFIFQFEKCNFYKFYLISLADDKISLPWIFHSPGLSEEIKDNIVRTPYRFIFRNQWKSNTINWIKRLNFIVFFCFIFCLVISFRMYTKYASYRPMYIHFQCLFDYVTENICVLK